MNFEGMISTPKNFFAHPLAPSGQIMLKYVRLQAKEGIPDQVFGSGLYPITCEGLSKSAR